MKLSERLRQIMLEYGDINLSEAIRLLEIVKEGEK